MEFEESYVAVHRDEIFSFRPEIFNFCEESHTYIIDFTYRFFNDNEALTMTDNFDIYVHDWELLENNKYSTVNVEIFIHYGDSIYTYIEEHSYTFNLIIGEV